MQKVLLGDSGDNVPGVRGLGAKTVLKLFPDLAEDTRISLEEVLNRCEGQKSKSYENIKTFEHQLKINEKLMDLHNPNISESDLEELDSVIQNPNRALKTLEFKNLYNEDSLGGSIQNLDMWLFNNFRSIAKFGKA
jgi:5'-3' exonuclease